MRSSVLVRWVGTACLGIGLACGSDEPPAAPASWGPAASAAKPGGENQAPSIVSLRIEPAEPVPGDRVRAVADVRDPDGGRVTTEFRWEVGGRVLDQTGAEIEVADVAKGDTVEVWVKASDGQSEAEAAHAVATVGNRRPRIANVALEPRGAVLPGQPALATPVAEDPDGDALSFRFRWSVNDETVLDSDASSFPTGDLKPDDEIRVQVIASDGDAESDAVWSGVLRVGNAAPEIVSRPGAVGPGEAFDYAVVARDPEGDRNLRYALRKGPEGMSINPVLGQLRWQPRVDQAGVHPVEIAVEDSGGARTVQSFELTVGSGAPVPAAPAPLAPPED